MKNRQFDVLIAYFQQDEALIPSLCDHLKKRGLNPWSALEQIQPGANRPAGLKQAIGKVKTVAVCIGAGELPQWELEEIEALLQKCAHISVFPVLLPGSSEIPKSLPSLKELLPVNFYETVEEEKALSRMAWGITGCRPAN